MSIKKFKFVSPGVFVKEIDNSQLTAIPQPVGPLVVGRTERGPAMKPHTVNSFAEFVEVFGNPIPGGFGGDVWRDGNYTAPTYAGYAAQAWLRNNAPVTIVRWLGAQHSDATAGYAGWKTDNTIGTTYGSGGAYGLFVIDSGSVPTFPSASIEIAAIARVHTEGGDSETGDSITLTDYNNTTVKYFFDASSANSTLSSSGGNTQYSFSGSTSDAEKFFNSFLVAVGQAHSGTITGSVIKRSQASADVVLRSNGNLGATSSIVSKLIVDCHTASAWTVDGAAVGTGTNVTGTFSVGSTGGMGVTMAKSGTLAAVWYLQRGALALSGNNAMNGNATTGSARLLKSVAAKTFKVLVKDTNAADITEEVVFNFDENSDKYIRNVFNTNPILTNSDIVDSSGDTYKRYWLGETFEREVDKWCTGSAQYGVILGLQKFNGGAGANQYSDRQYGMRKSTAGWFISQDLRSTAGSATAAENALSPEFHPTGSVVTKLFKIHSLEPGEWNQNNLKVSIEDVKYSTNKTTKYGTFTVHIRKIEDTDNAIKTVEKFTNCNLNPNSVNYLAKKIGDRYLTWDDTERRYTEYGNYDNRSNFVRVEISSDVDNAATDPELLPFGVLGPLHFKPFTIASGSNTPLSASTPNSSRVSFLSAFVTGGAGLADGAATDDSNLVSLVPTHVGIHTGSCPTAGSFSASFVWPSIPLRSSSLDGDLANPKDAYFGADVSRKSGGTFLTEFEASNIDLVRSLPGGYEAATVSSNPKTGVVKYQYTFSLDDLAATAGGVAWNEGSRRAGSSLTARSGSYKNLLDAGYDKFTTVLHGGYDGLDITEAEPFRNDGLTDGTVKTNYAYNSIKRAFDSVSDPEVAVFNLATMPGLTNTSLTAHLMNICEDRGDSLALVDLEGGYVPSTEKIASRTRGNVNTTVTNLRNRGLNTSYGAAYYPWVQVKDTISDAMLWVPPSVVALGTLSFTENRQELWFAPAGFNRGGLSQGTAGLPVMNVSTKLTSKERDKLYEANINPIASFPSEGIVIFGQKTLQVTPSALDRINVRRLLIFVKREISRMAATLLFDQNVRQTWNRFLGEVEPFLSSIRARLGLDDFRVLLDETTTTDELKDRNILYAKIFLKPTKAIEYIALDFNITNSGASFED